MRFLSPEPLAVLEKKAPKTREKGGKGKKEEGKRGREVCGTCCKEG